jgi:hypothetical protein
MDDVSRNQPRLIGREERDDISDLGGFGDVNQIGPASHM